MVSRNLPFYEFRPGIFEVDEFDCVSCFVVVGEKSALLLDVGTGIGDLRWVVENRITDKPYQVVASHNHGDHIGGAGFFDEIWMHPADQNLDSPPFAPTVDFRKNYAEIIRKREGKYYAYDPETDIRPWPKKPVWKPLTDGQVFDLGGRKVTALHCPGHTAGEMVFLDDKTHTLLCGDACNCNWLLNTTLAPTVRECVEISLKPDVMPNLIHCLEMILDGTAEYRQIPDALSDCGATKTVAMYKDVFVSCMGQDIEKVI